MIRLMRWLRTLLTRERFALALVLLWMCGLGFAMGYWWHRSGVEQRLTNCPPWIQELVRSYL